MNWIILIVAGLFEVAFATCLGKAKTAVGSDVYFYYNFNMFNNWSKNGFKLKITKSKQTIILNYLLANQIVAH